MKLYLEENSFYVKREDNDDNTIINIYRISKYNVYDRATFVTLDLDLVAREIKGDIEPINDAEDMFGESENCYILNESFKTCLEENGYKILDNAEVNELQEVIL